LQVKVTFNVQIVKCSSY